MYIFFPLTNSFSNDVACPLIVRQQYIQPIEVIILEYTYTSKLNHKTSNLVQNIRHEFSLQTEELKIIRALELLWPLLQTKNIIIMPAKLIVSSDTIRSRVPHGFSLMTKLRKFGYIYFN